MAIINNKIVSLGGKKVSKELKITKEKVLEASKKCEQAEEVLRAIFPEAFEEEWVDITSKVRVYLEDRGLGFRLFMDDEDGRYFAFMPSSRAEADIEIPVRVSYGSESRYKLELHGKNLLRILKRT